MNLTLTKADILALEKANASESLAEFAKLAWPVLEPATQLKWGWALDAVCEHLEAVTEGQIKRLLMNVPPGSMKSLLCGVIWPAWEWGPRGLPAKRFLGTAHSQSLAVRDSMKCRRLIQSAWYQERWPIRLTTDQNAKTKFENDATGFREAMAFTSMTGSRGDRVVLDDPLSADDANSEAELENARITFTETLPTRVNDDKSAIVVIMQRLSERDTSGVILDMGLPYDHLMIPMRFEADRRCSTGIGWEDPRKRDGELMFPERFPEEQVAELERTLGSYGTAGQLQQRPAPRGGGMFKREDLKVVDAAPVTCQWVRGWDLAATADENAARTAGVLLGRDVDGRFFVADVVKVQAGPGKVESLLKSTAALDGRKVSGSLPQDPGQAGKAQARHLVSMLAGYTYRATPETGDKITRAAPVAAQAEAGNFYIVKGAWNTEFIDELTVFPNGKFMDQVDALSRAFSELTLSPETRSETHFVAGVY